MPGASRRWFYLAWAGRVWMGGQCGAISVWRRRRTDPIDPLSKVLDGNEASLEGAKSRDIANYPKVPFPQSKCTQFEISRHSRDIACNSGRPRPDRSSVSKFVSR